MIGLYSARWCIARGYVWKHDRDCSDENAQAWLKYFQDCEPEIKFVLRDKKPSKAELYKLTGWKPIK